MLRITGILIGSALAVALLIVVLGLPQIGSDDVATSVWQETPEDVPQPLAVESDPVEPAEEPEPNPETEPEAIAAAPVETESVVLPADEPPVTDEALVEAIFAPAEERPLEIIEENWYAFWSPFRSEVAANGFVEQLQRTTGLDYRVVKQKAGVYEVAFAYDDEPDIQNKLAVISAATGLEMPGG